MDGPLIYDGPSPEFVAVPNKKIAWQPGDGAFRMPQIADKAARRYLRVARRRKAKPDPEHSPGETPNG